MNYNKANMEVYEMYLESNKARNYESMKTTYRVYKSNMLQYLQYLQKFEGNRLLLSENTIKNCVSILEKYINICRESGNNNQTINNKLTAISSFYIWCVKRDLISHHPFQHKLDRLKRGAFDKRRESYYLTLEEIIKARILMQHNSKRFDIQSKLLWELFLESANRISAIQNLKLSQLELRDGYFKNVKEKGDYIDKINKTIPFVLPSFLLALLLMFILVFMSDYIFSILGKEAPIIHIDDRLIEFCKWFTAFLFGKKTISKFSKK